MRILATVCFVLLLAMAVQAEVYTLSPDGVGDFPNIQAAISGCQDGDEIHLMDGVYNGTGNRDIDFMGRTITLRSLSDDPEACIIDFEGIHGNYISERGFMLESGEGPDTYIRGVTLRNGDGDGS